MPKIIENLRESILSEALHIIDEEGADKLNIRYLSKRLGIAASTIYNYYPSKEHVIGELAMRRWDEALQSANKEGSVLERLTFLAEELKRLVNPVISAHFAAGIKEEREEHSTEYMNMMFSQLQVKVREITGIADEDDLKVLTKLICACMHDDELKVIDIARVMRLI